MANLNKGLLLAIFAALILAGCNRQPPEKEAVETPAPVDLSQAVAKVGDEVIYTDDLRWYLETRPPAPGLQTADAAVRERLDGLVTEKLLAQAARAQGLDKDPVVKYAMEQILARQLLERQVIKPAMEREISDAEIKAYYETNHDLYASPKMKRLADIFLAAPLSGNPEIRQQKQEEALQLLAKARQVSSDRFGFSNMIQEFSDKHPLYAKGDTGFFDDTGKPLGLDENLVKAAFAFEKLGVVHNELVESRDGFHIIMLVGIRPAVEKKLESVSASIVQRIRKEEIENGRKKLIVALRSNEMVQKIDGNIARVTGEIETGFKNNRTTNRAGSGTGMLPNLGK